MKVEPPRPERRARVGSIERELHDVVVPQLFVLTTGLESLRRQSDPDVAAKLVVDLALTAERTMADVRAISRGEQLDWGGTVAEVARRLADWLRRTQRISGVTIRMHDEVADDARDLAVEGDLEYDIRAVVGEALANAVRHGRAEEIDVVFRVRGDVLSVQVRDDGTWGDSDPWGTGIDGLRARAQRRGGSFDLTRDGSATVLSWSVVVD